MSDVYAVNTRCARGILSVTRGSLPRMTEPASDTSYTALSARVGETVTFVRGGGGKRNRLQITRVEPAPEAGDVLVHGIGVRAQDNAPFGDVVVLVTPDTVIE